MLGVTALLTGSSAFAEEGGGAIISEPHELGPTPFVESEPLLAELRGLLSEDNPKPAALEAGLGSLEDWLQRAHSDPLAAPTARWLEARLLTRLGRTRPARAAWEALATAPGPFSDDAREVLAALDERRGQPAAAAHWRLTRSPSSPGFLAGAKKAAADLERLDQPERAIELLEQALEQGMDHRTRTALILLVAELHRAAGHEEHAKDLLLQTWWSVDRAPSRRLERALEALGALPDKASTAFREARGASRRASARLLKKPQRKRGPIPLATNALLNRWDDERAAASLDSLPELPADPANILTSKKNARGNNRATPDSLVTLAMTRGMLMRKLDRDAAAVDAFLFIQEHFPAHPLVHDARDQAATLLRALGRDDEADPLDLALLADSVPGSRHRSALWRLGFSAVQRGDRAAADRYLRDLEWRHGGDPDRHSFCWFERARYWRGRAAHLAGDAAAARSLWKNLISRYPAGWYALVARVRMGMEPASQSRERSALDRWNIAAEDPMATAVALYRVGEESLAKTHLEALLDADQLPGNGRRLLSDLYELSGESDEAERVLRHAAIPPTMPGDDPDETYYDWYPLRFEEALGQAARDNGLPTSLLAGVVSVETRFSASAKSYAGAIGAAQLLKSTGTAVGRKVFGKGFDSRTLKDPDVNLAVAARYLADLVARFHGHAALAVAAYNAGPGPVKRWLEARGALELDAFVETIPYPQARRYVMRVLSDAEIYRRLYGLDGRPIALPLSLARTSRR